MESNAPKLILVPVDFSAPSAQALRHAAALAERFSAHLLVLYADPFVPPIDYLTSAAAFDVPRDVRIEAACEHLQSFTRLHVPHGIPLDLRVLVDTAADAILTQAEESGADLIVMGTHGRTGIRRLFVGSVTEEVMRRAPVPVLSVRGGVKPRTTARWIAGCVTPVRECRAALRYATAWADDATRFVLFGAVDASDRSLAVDDLHLLDVCTPQEIADRTAFQAVTTMEAEQVLAAARAEQADLIVLGITGDRSFADSLRGTLAERIVQQSNCPVLTVNASSASRLLGAPVDERQPALAL